MSTAFAVLLLPLSIATGAMIDYAMLSSTRTHLNSAADAAALAAISNATASASAAAAQARAEEVFAQFTRDLPRTSVKSVTVRVDDDGLGRTATLSYVAEVRTAVMAIANFPSMTLKGSTSAQLSRSPFIDFYLVLDNSPSMGVAATTDDINRMVANTPDKCAFACHDLSANGNDYYALAKSLGVTMRIDVLRQATRNLMDTAATTATMSNQFRMALYTFGATASAAGLTNLVPLTTDLPSVKSAASGVDLMTIPYQNYNNDTQTPLTKVLTDLNTVLPSPGSGAWNTTPQKVLFLVSDGVADEVNTTSCQRPLTGTRCQQPINPDLCQAIKSRGIKIAVLYTSYLPLPTNSWYKSWIEPFAGSIGTKMQACATPGLYFEVSPSQGISEAMTALFKMTIASARLTR